MSTAPGNGHGKHEEQQGNSPADIPESPVYAYNLDETKTPGGIKVRWKIRVVDGPAAARYDTRQAKAIMEALEWIDKHPHRLDSPQ